MRRILEHNFLFLSNSCHMTHIFLFMYLLKKLRKYNFKTLQLLGIFKKFNLNYCFICIFRKRKYVLDQNL